VEATGFGIVALALGQDAEVRQRPGLPRPVTGHPMLLQRLTVALRGAGVPAEQPVDDPEIGQCVSLGRKIPAAPREI
jgi:hypothetical protein